MTIEGPFHGKDFQAEKYGGTELTSKEAGALHVELNERAETATSSYFATGDFLLCACG